MRTKRLGVIVNPVAGMGGRVGLKGTDGREALERARKLGASPESPGRAVAALRVVARIGDELEVLSYPREMGETEAIASGLRPRVIGSLKGGETGPQDTASAAAAMKEARVDLLLFVGGDGTARDIYRAVGRGVTVLGVPAGVKMHSAVFARTPRGAGEAAVSFLQSRKPGVTEGEVMDIDEQSFRKGRVVARLYGYMRIPRESRFVQGAKSGAISSEKETLQGIAAELASNMSKGCLYIFGPGTTTRDILGELGLGKTLLGVDAVLDGRLVGRDVGEAQLLELIDGREAKIVVTAIGGQGHIFGRGNQQISPRVIGKVGRENVIVVATKEKLASLQGRPMLVDTGDEKTDRALHGYLRVVTGPGEYVVYRVSG